MYRTEENQALYRHTELNDYESPAHIFALDYYRPESQGEDEFSRKETWYYYTGGEDLKEEFKGRIEVLLTDLFVDNTVDWDYFTLAPSREKDELNQPMQELCEAISVEGGIDYRQMLNRSREVEDSGEFGSVKQQVLNQEDSVEVTDDVEGDNIIIVDNVSVSGVSLAYLTQILMDAGAERVCCVCLGVTNHEREVDHLEEGVTASGAMIEEGGSHG